LAGLLMKEGMVENKIENRVVKEEYERETMK
jgi:hypothetical protein